MQFFRSERGQKALVAILLSSFLSFTILSWWLLFRDERALTAIGNFYPFLAERLWQMRFLLLKYGLNILPTLIFAGTGVIAFVAYFLSLKTNFSLKKSVVITLVFQAIIFASYPVLSTDIFAYIMYNRVSAVHGANPWLVSPNHFSSDPFGQLADWQEHPSVYGAVNQIIYLPAVKLAQATGDDLFATVVFHKLTALIFSIALIAVFLQILKGKSQTSQAKIIRTIFWNPLFLLEFVGSGHNDISMFVFLALGVLSWQKEKLLWAGTFLALAVQVKIIPVFLVGFLGVYLLQHKKIDRLVAFSASFLLINVLSFAYMQVSPLSFLKRVAFNNTVYWQSLPQLFSKFLPQLQVPFALIFLAVGCLLVFLQLKKKWQPLQTTALALLIYVGVFTSAYWNWYIFWPFLVAVLAGNPRLIKITTLITATSLMAYPILWLSHRFGFGWSGWDAIIYFLIFGVPVVGWRSGFNKTSFQTKKTLKNLY